MNRRSSLKFSAIELSDIWHARNGVFFIEFFFCLCSSLDIRSCQVLLYESKILPYALHCWFLTDLAACMLRKMKNQMRKDKPHGSHIQSSRALSTDCKLNGLNWYHLNLGYYPGALHQFSSKPFRPSCSAFCSANGSFPFLFNYTHCVHTSHISLKFQQYVLSPAKDPLIGLRWTFHQFLWHFSASEIQQKGGKSRTRSGKRIKYSTLWNSIQYLCLYHCFCNA